MTQRQLVTASRPSPDKQMDDFVDAMSTLVANAVADGIKAGLEAAGINTTVQNRQEFKPNTGFHAPKAASEPHQTQFKAPAARTDRGFLPPRAAD